MTDKYMEALDNLIDYYREKVHLLEDLKLERLNEMSREIVVTGPPIDPIGDNFKEELKKAAKRGNDFGSVR